MTKKTIMLCATLFVFFAATAFALCKSSNDKSMKQSDAQRTEKILFVNGSPNRDGNTATLAKELLEGKEYETIALTDYRINFYGQTLDGDQFDEVYKNERSRCRGDGFACLLAQYLCLYAHAFRAFLWSDRAWLV